MTEQQIKFVNALGWVSITLANWARNEFNNGSTLEDVKHRLGKAMDFAAR